MGEVWCPQWIWEAAGAAAEWPGVYIFLPMCSDFWTLSAAVVYCSYTVYQQYIENLSLTKPALYLSRKGQSSAFSQSVFCCLDMLLHVSWDHFAFFTLYINKCLHHFSFQNPNILYIQGYLIYSPRLSCASFYYQVVAWVTVKVRREIFFWDLENFDPIIINW